MSLGSAGVPRLSVCPIGGLPGHPLPPVESVGAVGAPVVPVRTSGQAMLLWMMVVAGLAASLLRKVYMVVGVSEVSGAMVLSPVTSVPLTWLLPWTVFWSATVLNAFSTFCS